MLTKEQAIGLFGTRGALQKALGLRSHAAISMWKAGEAIPEAHELRIRYQLMPQAFNEDGTLRLIPAKPTDEPKQSAAA